MNRLWLVIALLIVGGAAGCKSLAPPNWFHPGPAAYQQSQAQQYDPYPDVAAGPEIVGGRPMEYDRPPAEVVQVQPPTDPMRSTWLPWNWGRR